MAPTGSGAAREEDAGVGGAAVEYRAGRQQGRVVAGQGGADAGAAGTAGLQEEEIKLS